MDEICFEENAQIEVVDYHRLRLAAGMGIPPISDVDLKAALQRSWNVVARSGQTVVGMGRLLDDGALYGSIWDMLVTPELQRRGIGEALLERLLEQARNLNLIALIATPAGRPLYERHGFATESHGSVGMLKRNSKPHPVEPEPRGP